MYFFAWAWAAPEAAPDWQRTLDAVIPAVVSIQVTAPRDFDTEDAGTSQGTGFVVDAERGLILTNRHMVHTGPVVAQATFADDEELDLVAVYRDPVHDFGVYRFDPRQLRHMPVSELRLSPDRARPGLDIRVVGNDAGEKISILDGTLARLDRNAPWYGVGYSDFNTFYFQAASNTSGGSSGSPVVDATGQVVALNAGASSEAASSFYLPLDRVVVALEHLRRGEAVPRGALPARFAHTPYPEVGRLGLRPDEEARVRASHPDSHGMLVVEATVPGATRGEGPLRPGDVLLSVDGASVVGFAELEGILDAAVGRTVAVSVARGAARLTLDVSVDDLHARSPSEFLEIGRAVLNDISYMQSALRNLPAEGVWVATPGYMLSNADVPEAAILQEINGERVARLADAVAALSRIPHGARFRARWVSADDLSRGYDAVIEMDRAWFSARTCARDRSGDWPCEELPAPGDAPRITVPAPAPPVGRLDPRAKRLGSALALVTFDIPYPTSGVSDLHYTGVGVVVDAETGLMLVDRDTVPVTLGDIRVRFAGARAIPAEVAYLSAVHDFAVIRYDPTALSGWTPAEVSFADRAAQPGDPAWLLGLDGDHEVVVLSTRVEDRAPLVLNAGSTPRFRDTNLEVLDLRETVQTYGGVILDRRGAVTAQWASFVDQASGDRTFHGLPANLIEPVVRALIAGETPRERAIGAELRPVSLSDAIERGLAPARVEALRALPRSQRLVFEVERVWTGSEAAAALRPSDLVLTLDGSALTRIAQVGVAERSTGLVPLRVQRGDGELDVSVSPLPLDGDGVDRVLSWAGMIVHDAHPEVSAEHDNDGSGAYVAWLWYGSPASRYGLRPTRRVVAVNGVETPDLEAFAGVVRSLAADAPVRLTMRDLDDRMEVATLRLDPHYWPAAMLSRVDGRWVRSAW